MRRAVVVLLAALTVFVLLSCAPRETVQPVRKPVKVALVLGAGASRGFAHIGVLKVLEANRIPVHLIVGTSAGSFVGSLSAYGYNAFQIQKMALGIEKSDIADITIPDNGFIKGERLEEYVNRLVKNTPIEKMRTPFYAVTTDVQAGREVIFGSGNTGTAVRASCAIPGVFRPVKIEGRMYVDGGVVSPLPVDAARKMGADIVIAVDISAGVENRQPDTTIDTILQAVDIMHAKISAIQAASADVLIRPRVGFIGASDFSKRHEAIIEGEKAAAEMLPIIRAAAERMKEAGKQ